jgi:hypothetical protein
MSGDDDQAFRQHQAANDPAFPARREEAHRLIVAALDQLLQPEGYVRRGSTWSRATAQGKSALHLQRDRYGWDVRIVLRFVTPEGEVPDHPDWPGGEDITLAHFFEEVASDPGRLAFLDVLADPVQLDHVSEILRDQVLPWFRALHGED